MPTRPTVADPFGRAGCRSFLHLFDPQKNSLEVIAHKHLWFPLLRSGIGVLYFLLVPLCVPGIVVDDKGFSLWSDNLDGGVLVLVADVADDDELVADAAGDS